MKRTGRRRIAFDRLQLNTAAQNLAAQRGLLLLCAVLLLGAALGALLCRKTEALPQSAIAVLADEFSARRSDQGFWLTFAFSFEALFLLFLMLFLSGVSAVGVVTVPLVLFFRGAGFGLVAGYFYAVHAFRGFLYVLLFLLPNVFFSSLAFLVLGRESIRLSRKILQTFRPDAQGKSVRSGFRLYCIRSGLILILLCVSALLESVLTVAFGAGFVP